MLEKNYYKILQIAPSAEPEVILAAYNRLVQKYLLDTSASSEGSHLIQELSEAVEILNDPARRAAYDRQHAKHKQIPRVNLQLTLAFDVTMSFVRVPAGKFRMGSKADNTMAASNEHPQHQFKIPYDYWIARYPTTNEQFALFVTSSGYKFDQGMWQTKADHPVVNVSWRDAMAYCQWINTSLHDELKDLTLRLPTEPEWEKAARGVHSKEWPWGNKWDWQKCNSRESDNGGTTPVGAYSPQGDSPYGAADMAGNVWEWCHSMYKPYPYQANDDRENEAGDDVRVLRGGFWRQDREFARCASRDGYHPENRYDFGGFRCVLCSVSRFHETP